MDNLRIIAGDKDLGGGFALNPTSVITANHVIHGRIPDDLHVLLEDGEKINVKSVEGDDVLDAAVLILDCGVKPNYVLSVGEAKERERWIVDTQPLSNDPRLSGVIDSIRREYTNSQGHRTHGLQLLVNQIMKNYGGYSGSPVMLDAGAPMVIGIMVEQVHERSRTTPGEARQASNVLYATPIEDVLTKFRIQSVAKVARPSVTSYLPELPSKLLLRDREFNVIKNELLHYVKSPRVAGCRIAITGMGGVGKTVIATRISQDSEISKVFDKIVALSFDEQNLVDQQRRLANAFKKSPEFNDWRDGRAFLREILHDQSCLIILDNVSDANELEAFDVLGPQVHLLFTTRIQELATSYSTGESLNELKLLEKDEAKDLLLSWAGQTYQDLPPEASKILEHCGGLPLAIALSGAMVRGRPERWKIILRKFQDTNVLSIAAKIPGYPHPNLLVALEISIDELDSAGEQRGLLNARERYMDMVIFKGRGQVPINTLKVLWDDVGVADRAEDYVDFFLDRSLLIRGEKEHIKLHDLYMDCIKSLQNEDGIKVIHRRLVDSYVASCQGELERGKDDGYYFQHLPYHLSQAGYNDKLNALLLDPGWMRAKLTTVGFQDLIMDYELAFPADNILQIIQLALRQSFRALRHGPDHLESQLIGRLTGTEDPKVSQFLDVIKKSRTGTWLKPMTGSLIKPGGLVERILTLPEDPSINVINIGGDERVAISADGKIAVCNTLKRTKEDQIIDPVLLVWNLENFDEPKEIKAQYADGYLAVTRDCHISALARSPNHLELIDLVSGNRKAHTTINLNPTSIAISDDPIRVVIGHIDGSVMCWEPLEDKLYSSNPYRSESVRDIAISKDGKIAIVISKYGSLVRLSLPDMNIVETVGRDDGAFSLSLSADGRTALTGGHYRRLLIWDLVHKKVHKLPVQDARFKSVFVVDGNRAITLLEDQTLQIWDLNEQSLLFTERLGSRIGSFSVSQNGSTAVARSGDDRVLVFNLDALTVQSSAKGEGVKVSVAVTPDATIAFSGTDTGTLFRYDISLENEHISQRIAAKQNIDGKYLSFTGDWSGMVRTIDVRQDPPSEFERSIGGDIDRLGVSSNGECVVWTSLDRSITIWEASKRAPQVLMWGGGSLFVNVTISLNGFISITERSGEIWSGFIEDNSSWNEWFCDLDLRMENEDRILVATSSDGHSRLLGTINGFLILETDDRETYIKTQAHQSVITTVAITPDNKCAVSGAKDGTVAIWKPNLSSSVHLFKAHSDPLSVVVISPDGQFVVTGSTTDELILWSISDFAKLASFQCDGRIKDIALASGADLIVVTDVVAGIHFLRPMNISLE